MQTGFATTPLLAPSTQPGGAFLFTDEQRSPPSAGFAPAGWSNSRKVLAQSGEFGRGHIWNPWTPKGGEAGKVGVRGRDYAGDPEDGPLRSAG